MHISIKDFADQDIEEAEIVGNVVNFSLAKPFQEEIYLTKDELKQLLSMFDE